MFRLAMVFFCFVMGVLGLAACSAEVPPPVSVIVEGTMREAPQLIYQDPVAITESSWSVVWPGHGPQVAAGDQLLLQLYAEDGRNHQVITNTYDIGPQAFTLDVASLGSELMKAIQGQRVGARVLFQENSEGTPMILVVDLVPTHAVGDEVPLGAGFPEVTLGVDGVPVVQIEPETTPPQDLEFQPLIRGLGSQVAAGDRVALRYVSVAWSTGEVVDSNWSEEGTPPLVVTLGVGSLVEGLEQGLLEQSVGSRILLVVPPNLAYEGTDSAFAEQTLVYVVDILDTRSSVSPSEEESS